MSISTIFPRLGSSRSRKQAVAERLMLRELLRRVEMKVIQKNRLDVVVRLHTSLPPGKIGLAPWPGPALHADASSSPTGRDPRR